MRKLSVLHALHLFNQGRYDVAIDAFISLDLSPSKVIALYPEPISGKLFLEASAREEIFGGRGKERVEAEMEKEEERRSGEASPSRGVAGEVQADLRSAMKGGKSDDAASIMSGRSVVTKLRGSTSWLKERDSRSDLAAAVTTGQTSDEMAEIAAGTLSLFIINPCSKAL